MSVFGGDYPDYETTLFDYALIVIDEKTNTPMTYTLVRIVKTDTFYIEFGGSFPEHRSSPRIPKAFKFILEEMRKVGFKMCLLMTLTENAAMQKLALHCGFRVFGVTMGQAGLCLEYRLQLKEEEK